MHNIITVWVFMIAMAIIVAPMVVPFWFILSKVSDKARITAGLGAAILLMILMWGSVCLLLANSVFGIN